MSYDHNQGEGVLHQQEATDVTSAAEPTNVKCHVTASHCATCHRCATQSNLKMTHHITVCMWQQHLWQPVSHVKTCVTCDNLCHMWQPVTYVSQCHMWQPVSHVSQNHNVTCDNLLSDASIEEQTNSTCDRNKTRRQWSSLLLLLHWFCITIAFWNCATKCIGFAKHCNAMLYNAPSAIPLMSNPC